MLTRFPVYVVVKKSAHCRKTANQATSTALFIGHIMRLHFSYQSDKRVEVLGGNKIKPIEFIHVD